MKSKQHIQYQSQGMDLTQRRVDFLNMVLEEKVLIEVSDVLNEAGIVSGTEVKVTLTQLKHDTGN